MLLRNMLPIGGVIAALAFQGLASSQFYEIRGVQDGVDPTSGARPLRLNIADFQKDRYALYVVMYIYESRQRVLSCFIGHCLYRRLLPYKIVPKTPYHTSKFVVSIKFVQE